MRASSIEYTAPAMFDDLIEVFIRISRLGRTSVTYEFAAFRVEDDLVLVDREADPRPRRPRRAEGVPDSGVVSGDDREVRGRRHGRPGTPS